MRFLFFADAVSTLKPKSDSGLSLLRASLRRGHEAYWCTVSDFLLSGGPDQTRILVRARNVEKCEDQGLPILGDEAEKSLDEFHRVWIRKDPPFDSTYLSLCWLFSLEERKTRFLNPPSVLIQHHEKLLPYQGLRMGILKGTDLIPTLMGSGPVFGAKPQWGAREVISKPWLGYGGREIRKWKSLKSAPYDSWTMYQPLLSSVATKGDRRVFFLGGKYIGDVVRIPAQGKLQANLSQGGTARLAPLSQEEKELTARMETLLTRLNIDLAGADYLEGKVSEINITAPTGFEAIVDLGGPQLADAVVEYAEKSA